MKPGGPECQLNLPQNPSGNLAEDSPFDLLLDSPFPDSLIVTEEPDKPIHEISHGAFFPLNFPLKVGLNKKGRKGSAKAS